MKIIILKDKGGIKTVYHFIDSNLGVEISLKNKD